MRGVDRLDPGVELGDGVFEGEGGIAGCCRRRVVGGPVVVRDGGRWPGALRAVESARFRGAGLEQRDARLSDFGECRGLLSREKVAQEQQVDGVAGAVVAQPWRFVRVGAAWIFCAIWNRMAMPTRWSGVGSPK